ncbi:YfcE family phosphodiesterase [Thermosulfuriphilus sp.]
MLVAIISDSHDHIWNMHQAIEEINARGAECLIHCGDLISPFMIKELAAFSGPKHLILGNNPGDVWLLSKTCARSSQVFLHGWFANLEIDGLKVAVVHFPEMARGLAATGEYDLVCCGHTHVYNVFSVGKTLVVNPGEILGKEGPPTFALFETQTRKLEKVIL